jgi:hypothetical protein
VQEFLLVSPLPNWRGNEQKITDEIGIRQLRPKERQALQYSATLLEHHDVDEAAKDSWWLCYEFDNPHPADNIRHRRRLEAAFKLAMHAQYAVQILAPAGAPNVYLLYRRTGEGLELETTQKRLAFIPSVWGRVAAVPAEFGEQVPALLDGMREVFQKPILRLQIPVWLLEQGLAAPDRHIRILLWATGLDGLTRSGGIARFSERLCELLGPAAHIFPPAEGYRRPVHTVGDVTEDLYQLRTEMAHGLPFHEKFRKTRGLLAEGGEPVCDEFAGWRYDQVLEECAVFLLCNALRETVLRG